MPTYVYGVILSEDEARMSSRRNKRPGTIFFCSGISIQRLKPIARMVQSREGAQRSDGCLVGSNPTCVRTRNIEGAC